MGTLKRQTLFDGLRSPCHDALLIEQTALSELGVNGFQINTLWERNEIVPSCIADQIFDTSLLPASMHIGKESFKAIDTLKVYKHLVFSPTVSFQHLKHG